LPFLIRSPCPTTSRAINYASCRPISCCQPTIRGQGALQSALWNCATSRLDLPHSRDYFVGLFAAAGIEPRVAFRSRSFEMIRGLIGHGQGYSIHNAVPRTTIGYDGSRIAVVPIVEPLPPTHVTVLRLKPHTPRPAVQSFAEYTRDAFAIGGLFGPGSIAPPGVDAT
jgi:DNA-binding transcriptional LysR family regulator